MIQSTVKFFDAFGSIMEDLDRLAVNGLDAAAAEAAGTAAALGAPRGMTDFQVIEAHGDIDGYQSGIRGARWYWRLQSFGTLGRALHPKRPGTKRSHRPGTGVEPNLMYQTARRNGRRKLLETLSRGL